MTLLLSASSAACERQRLASSSHILAFGLGVAMILLAAFPDQSLQRHLERSIYGDEISQAYFSEWLRAKPNDHHLRLILVRHQIQQGDLKQAEDNLVFMLAELGVEGANKTEAMLLLLDVKKQYVWRTEPNSLPFANARRVYLTLLQRVSRQEWDAVHLQGFASDALALGERTLWLELNMRMLRANPERWSDQRLNGFAQQLLAIGNINLWLELNMLMLKTYPNAWDSQRLEDFADKLIALGYRQHGLDMYARLLISSHHQSDDWYQRVSQLYLADGHYREAANLYFQALPYAASTEQRRHRFLTGLGILQSGNLLEESLLASEIHLGSLVSDVPTLRYLVKLSQASNRLDLAEKYVNLLLKRHSV